MNPTQGTQAAFGLPQGGTEFFYTPSPDGGYNFYRRDTSPAGNVNVTPITREAYARSMGGYPADTVPQTQAAAGIQETTAGTTMAAQEDPYAAAARAQAAAIAAEERKKTGLREGIRGLIGQAGDIYRNIYGGLTRQAEAQKGQLEQTYGKGVQTLGETYTAELPKIAQAYAARGAYDSTWRAGAEQEAQRGYEKQLGEMGTAQQEALRKLGQTFAESRAQFGAGETGLQTILGRLGDVTDLNELTALRNQIENQITSLRQAEATQLTPEQQSAVAAQLPAANDRFAQAQTTIRTIIAGQAPAMLKRSIANQIIVNSPLTDEEKRTLQAQVNTEIV